MVSSWYRKKSFNCTEYTDYWTFVSRKILITNLSIVWRGLKVSIIYSEKLKAFRQLFWLNKCYELRFEGKEMQKLITTQKRIKEVNPFNKKWAEIMNKLWYNQADSAVNSTWHKSIFLANFLANYVTGSYQVLPNWVHSQHWAGGGTAIRRQRAWHCDDTERVVWRRSWRRASFEWISSKTETATWGNKEPWREPHRTEETRLRSEAETGLRSGHWPGKRRNSLRSSGMTSRLRAFLNWQKRLSHRL